MINILFILFTDILLFTEAPMPSIGNQFTKFQDLQTAIVTLPNALGLLTFFELVTPSLFNLTLASLFHFQPRILRSAAGNLIIPETINMTSDLQTM